MRSLPSVEESVGQILTIGFEGQSCDSQVEAFLRKVRPGGVIFFKRNIAAPEQFQSLVGRVSGLLGDSLPFLALDHEGGEVDRLRAVLAPLASVRDASRAGLGRELGNIAGKEVAAFSLNVNFAPVLDLGTPDSRTALGSRTAGETPDQVILFAEDFLRGLSEQGIVGCGKHFPGLGNGRKDSHIGMPVIEKSAEDLWAQDLKPFRALAAQLPMVMVAHACYQALEDEAIPATLSRKIVSSILKERIGYQGLVVCDDLEMGGVLEGRSIGEAAVQAMRAGCDILLVCEKPSNVEAVLQALIGEASNDPSFANLISEAAEKIAVFKQRFISKRTSAPSAPAADWNRLRDEIRAFSAVVDRRLSATSAGAGNASGAGC